MNRRRAVLLLIAALVVADLAGAAYPWALWQNRHDHQRAAQHPGWGAVAAQPRSSGEKSALDRAGH